MDRADLLAHLRATHLESGDRERARSDARRIARFPVGEGARRVVGIGSAFDAGLAGTLEEYLRFRHVFGNVYGAVPSAERMRSLEARMPATLEAFRDRIRSFLAWMREGE